MNPFASYTAQIWDHQTLVQQIAGLSIDAAREIARSALITGNSGRVWCDSENYTEVYAVDGSVRTGRYEETTLVRY